MKPSSDDTAGFIARWQHASGSELANAVVRERLRANAQRLHAANYWLLAGWSRPQD